MNWILPVVQVLRLLLHFGWRQVKKFYESYQSTVFLKKEIHTHMSFFSERIITNHRLHFLGQFSIYYFQETFSLHFFERSFIYYFQNFQLWLKMVKNFFAFHSFCLYFLFLIFSWQPKVSETYHKQCTGLLMVRNNNTRNPNWLWNERNKFI